MKRLLVSALTLICWSTYAQVRNYVSTTDLLAWYPFTGNAIDSSGNGLDGTVSATATTDRFGASNSAYLFDGSSSYITAAPTSAIDTRSFQGYSYSFWFQFNGNTGNPQTILQYRNIGDQAISFRHDDTARWFVRLNFEIYSSAILSKTSWHHIVFTSDFTEAGKNISTVYINGRLAVGDTTIIFKPIMTNIEIGRWYSSDWGYGWYFNGKIDDIGLWKRALTPCEVTELNLGKVITITRNPDNDTALSGGTAVFSISDTGGAATYQWQFNTGFGYADLTNGGSFSGVNSKVLTINPVGTAMSGALVRCIRTQGYCEDTSGAARLSLNTTGVENTLMESIIEVNPNPATDRINIASSITIRKVKIFNILGACVVNEQSEAGITSVDLASISSGVYTIQLNDLYYRRVVKE
jgi:hypothetical protein